MTTEGHESTKRQRSIRLGSLILPVDMIALKPLESFKTAIQVLPTYLPTMITSRIGLSPALKRTPRLGRWHPIFIPNRSRPILNQQRPFSHLVAKSGSLWTLNDLKSFNIHLQEQDPLTFFGVQELPEPAVDPELLNVRDAHAMLQDRHAMLITYLKLAMHPSRGGQSDGIEFAVALLRLMGYYTAHGRLGLVFTRKVHAFVMCGEHRRAATDVCVADCSSSPRLNVLLVQQIRHTGDREPEGNVQAQLVAQAVAAFTENNMKRRKAGLEPVLEKVMPGIVTVGTSPVFFKIPVSETLLTHIRHGTRPEDITTVTFCRPPVPRPARSRSEGMMPLDARRQILSCYEAFKKVVGI